jgi:hypothetical protein
VFIAKVNGIDFYIFSGIEDVFVGDRKKINPARTDPSNANYRVWTLMVQSDSILVQKDTGKPFLQKDHRILK